MQHGTWEGRSTWVQGALSNIYAHQPVHSLWPAVYICNFPRQICHYTHHPASANSKIYQHANKWLYHEQIFPSVKLKLNVSGTAAKCSSALKLVCTEIKDQIFLNNSKSPEGQTAEREPKDGWVSKWRRGQTWIEKQKKNPNERLLALAEIY